MKILILTWMVFPLSLIAQSYSDSIFLPGETAPAPPIGLGKKISIHATRAIGPRSLTASLFVAGINQWKDSPGEWGHGWDGYGKRYGSSVGRSVVREAVAAGGDGAFKTDPRTYKSASKKMMPRLRDALMQVVVTRTDSGKRVPAFANVGSAFAAGQIETLWLPRGDAHFSDGLTYAGVMLLGDAGRNVFKEFWPDVRRKFRH